MHFGLTQRELVQYTQSQKPDATKRGTIDDVLSILNNNYEKHEHQRLSILCEEERKRIQRIEAESGLNPLLRPYPKAQKPRRKKRNVVKEDKVVDDTWSKTQKPGYMPPPGIESYHHKMTSSVLEDKDKLGATEPLKNESPQHKPQPEVQKQVNPDACLHLPLGMVRNPSPRTRKLLESQQNEPLYELANRIVHLSKTDNNRK